MGGISLKKCLIRKGLILGIILLFIGAGIIPSTVGIKKEKTQIQTIKSGGYIQSLIDNASDGDTIYIPSGIYYENIIINKSISLIGEDKNTTIINGGLSRSVVNINANWVDINGFTLKNSSDEYGEDAAIILEASYSTIKNNILVNVSDGIFLSGCHNSIISNLIETERDGAGINLAESSNNLIDGNQIFYSNIGILLFGYWVGCSNNIISNNSFFCTGFLDLGSFYDENVNNTFLNNSVNGKPFIYLENESNIVIDNAGQIILINCENITIKNQNLSNTTMGINLDKTNNTFISNCTINANSHDGIWIKGDNNVLEHNTFIQNRRWGLFVRGVGNKITNNNISENGEIGILHHGEKTIITKSTLMKNMNGILLGGGDSNKILNNIISNNNEYGLRLYGSGRNLILKNIISHNENGIDYDNFFTSYTVIEENDISNNSGFGIKTCGQKYNITRNIISNNGKIGISIFLGSDNRISNNQIINNRLRGVFFEDTNENFFSNNTISLNSEEGIILLNSDNNSIEYNNFFENEDGLELEDSNHNVLCNNLINLNNDHGIEIIASSSGESINNSIISNIIKSNNNGVYLENASSNTIEKNNFLKNQRNALFNDCINIWEQNYWNRPRFLPKLIFGKITIIGFLKIPWFNIDWHPAPKPYEIEA